MKIMKLSIHVSFLLSVMFFLLSFISIINLALTENKITNIPLTSYYIAKIENGEQDIEVFKDYMELKGWSIVNQNGDSYLFEKNGNQREVFNTQVKTLIIDGNINIQYLKNL
ncbi:hypothetical protein [Litchfieldia salsa]|uniref:Uncharacterized protein n=1 Tax=Litchfieldia salsa TaxID=930152 RepID=A0A1H0RYA6_9BACI|nr:hypothetical protein [Litchfieldia salsa]SDP34470.1 hypothetical protein SAMN05216565_102443 [Litchfieldia salsa]